MLHNQLSFRSMLLLILFLTYRFLPADPLAFIVPTHLTINELNYDYYEKDTLIATARIEINPAGRIENNFSIVASGNKAFGKLIIETDSNSKWEKIGYSGPLQYEITRDSFKALISVMGQNLALSLIPEIALFEDMTPILIQPMIDEFDRAGLKEKKGKLLFLPANILDYDIRRGGPVLITHENTQFRFYTYTLSIPGVYDMKILVDENKIPCLITYPSKNGFFVRQGFDFLLQEKRNREKKSNHGQNSHIIIDKNMKILMKDGIPLATDIYRPCGNEQHPVILIRTAYRKESQSSVAEYYAQQGFAVAIQDARGRFSSPGEWMPFVHEGEDGYQTIEWLARQPWSNGRVGMMGGSYDGWLQWKAASLKPPHLVTIIPSVSPPDLYELMPYENGALLMAPTLWWLYVLERNLPPDLSDPEVIRSLEILESAQLNNLPVASLDSLILGKESRIWREWLNHPDYDSYWQNKKFANGLCGVNIPVYHQSGWFDGDGIGTRLNYQRMVQCQKENQKLIIGPWSHSGMGSPRDAKGMDWGQHAWKDFLAENLRWMNRYLKGIENGIDREPWVSLFVLGKNEWITSNRYPLEETHYINFYLQADTSQHIETNIGLLSSELPTPPSSGYGEYIYDPDDPTGFNPVGRKDLLLYYSPKAEHAWTVVGPITAILYASSSALDTDWIMRLAKIDPDGKPRVLTEGIIRARYRKSFTEPQNLTPNQIYQYRIEMNHIGVEIQRGEQLCLAVQSALFPKFSRNLNSGGDNEHDTNWVRATQRVYYGKNQASHIVLPVLEHDK